MLGGVSVRYLMFCFLPVVQRRELEYDKHLRDKMIVAKNEFRALLRETKMITYRLVPCFLCGLIPRLLEGGLQYPCSDLIWCVYCLQCNAHLILKTRVYNDLIM